MYICVMKFYVNLSMYSCQFSKIKLTDPTNTSVEFERIIIEMTILLSPEAPPAGGSVDVGAARCHHLSGAR